MNEFYEDFKADIDAALENCIPNPDLRSCIVLEAMQYSIRAGGKRLRPVLLLEACEAVGGDPETALPFACALELIHTYSLIHDDLPAMDDDELRRGMPTNHRIFGEDIAILAGDGLLNTAYEIMLEDISRSQLAPDDQFDMGHAKHITDSYNMITAKLAALKCIAEAAGIRGMIGGQTADVMMTESRHKRYNEETLENSLYHINDRLEYEICRDDDFMKMDMLTYIHESKTAALIKAAVLAGAYLGGADEAQLKALETYAVNLGLAFQIVDDILDEIGDEDEIGKKPGSDKELGKLTFPLLHGLEKSRELCKEATRKGIEALSAAGIKGDSLKALAIDLESRIS